MSTANSNGKSSAIAKPQQASSLNKVEPNPVSLESIASLFSEDEQAQIVSVLLSNLDRINAEAEYEENIAFALESMRLRVIESAINSGKNRAQRMYEQKPVNPTDAPDRFIKVHLPNLMKRVNSSNYSHMQPIVEELAKKAGVTLHWSQDGDKISCTGQIALEGQK